METKIRFSEFMKPISYHFNKKSILDRRGNRFKRVARLTCLQLTEIGTRFWRIKTRLPGTP